MFDVYALMAGLLFICASMFFFAGSRPLLNTVDYLTIDDPRAFNKFVGVRMFIPALVASVCSLVTYYEPNLALPLLMSIPLSVLGVVIWVAVGSKKFSAGSAVKSRTAAFQETHRK